MNSSEREWEAESDARTLARAEEIKADSTKLSMAKIAAKRMVVDEELRLKGLRKVSGKNVRATPDSGIQDAPISEPIPTQSAGPKLKFGIGKQPGTW